MKIYSLLLVDESSMAATTVLTVLVGSHEGSSTAGLALTTETRDLAGLINLVELKDGELDLQRVSNPQQFSKKNYKKFITHLLVHVRLLLGGRVGLLLTLLGTTTKTEHKVKGRLLLDVVVGKSTAIFELLAGEDKTLLIGRDSFLVLDLSLDVVDGIGGVNLEGDGLAREGLHENLHG